MKKDAGGGGDDGIEGRRELGKDGVQRWRDETAMLLLSGTSCHLQRALLHLRARLARLVDSTPANGCPRPWTH
jgi:hypothetical protein